MGYSYLQFSTQDTPVLFVASPDVGQILEGDVPSALLLDTLLYQLLVRSELQQSRSLLLCLRAQLPLAGKVVICQLITNISYKNLTYYM